METICKCWQTQQILRYVLFSRIAIFLDIYISLEYPKNQAKSLLKLLYIHTSESF